jgi:hypothetical protein
MFPPKPSSLSLTHTPATQAPLSALAGREVAEAEAFEAYRWCTPPARSITTVMLHQLPA